MKKQNLKKIKLTKRVISNLENINGGAQDRDTLAHPLWCTLPIQSCKATICFKCK